MTNEYVGETFHVRDWCPECEPDLDQIMFHVVEVYCYRHRITESGLDDDVMLNDKQKDTLTECQMNRAFCDLLHRGKLPDDP